MPNELLFLNQQDPTLPCGTFSTSTMHIVLRNSSNITKAACKDYNASDPLNAVGLSAEQIRASYGQDPPENVDATVPAGIWSLAQQCNREVAAAAAADASTTIAPVVTSAAPVPAQTTGNLKTTARSPKTTTTVSPPTTTASHTTTTSPAASGTTSSPPSAPDTNAVPVSAATLVFSICTLIAVIVGNFLVIRAVKTRPRAGSSSISDGFMAHRPSLQMQGSGTGQRLISHKP